MTPLRQAWGKTVFGKHYPFDHSTALIQNAIDNLSYEVINDVGTILLDKCGEPCIDPALRDEAER